MELGISRILDISFEAARERVETELKKEGFGVLTEIDVKATFQKKLNIDFRNYVILGACNPHFAHKALEQNLEIGVLLPCNVIIYDNEEGKIVVTAMNVTSTMGTMLPDMADIAGEVGNKLQAVMDRL